ncbi:MAG: SpoIIIAH-like family protein [Clostridia bacterium]|nr:SpoIIIAH-like family protein [Clostridia bacterium]
MSKSQKFRIQGKQVLLLGLVALVITAGYYRWTIETDRFDSVSVAGDAVPQNAENSGKTKGMAELRQERDQSRSASIEEWEKTAESKDASQAMKAEAEKKKKTATEWMEKEKNIETLIKAKGYEDCFAHLSENGISVMVSGGEINGSKVAQMKDIIVAETNLPVRDIKISAESF